MREVEFRAKDRLGKWRYGYLLNNAELDGAESENLYIRDKKTGVDFSAIPETVGQFTGIKDKNGRKVFEGDLFKFDYDWSYEVSFKDGAFGYYGEVTGEFYPFAEDIDLVDGVILDMEVFGTTTDGAGIDVFPKLHKAFVEGSDEPIMVVPIK